MAMQAAGADALSSLGSSFKPVMMLVGLAAAVAAGVGVVLWSQGPTYGLLYSNLADEEAAAITQSLSSAGIKYRMENGTGGISVPVERINEARLMLAGQGVLQSGGFASLSKEGGLGVSQFMESARYQHALEQELARTISSLQQVAAAREKEELAAQVAERHRREAADKARNATLLQQLRPRALPLLAVFFLLNGCQSTNIAPVGSPAATRAITASANQIVGRVLAVDATLGFAIIEIAASAPPAALQPDALLTTRTDDLRPTAQLRSRGYRSSRTLGSFIIDGQPNLRDEVVYRAP